VKSFRFWTETQMFWVYISVGLPRVNTYTQPASKCKYSEYKWKHCPYFDPNCDRHNTFMDICVCCLWKMRPREYLLKPMQMCLVFNHEPNSKKYSLLCSIFTPRARLFLFYWLQKKCGFSFRAWANMDYFYFVENHGLSTLRTALIPRWGFGAMSLVPINIGA
jgi:hypothetical protein